MVFKGCRVGAFWNYRPHLQRENVRGRCRYIFARISAYFPHHSLADSGRCSRRFVKTSSARFRLATAPNVTSSWRSSCRRHWPGLAGSTKAIALQLASLTDVQWQMSGEVVLMTLVGGLGTIYGPVVGATFIISMESCSRYFWTMGDYHPGHNLRPLRTAVSPRRNRRIGCVAAHPVVMDCGKHLAKRILVVRFPGNCRC